MSTPPMHVSPLSRSPKRRSSLTAALISLACTVFSVSSQARDADATLGFGGPGAGAGALTGQARINVDLAGSNRYDSAVSVIPIYTPTVNFGESALVGYWVVGQACRASPSPNCPLVEIVISKLTANGKPDVSFGSGGTVLIDQPGWSAVKVATTGYSTNTLSHLYIGGTKRLSATDQDFAIIEVDNAGAVVPSFGFGGERTVAFDLGGGNNDDQLSSLILAAAPTVSGSYAVLYAVGSVQRSNPADYDFAIARINLNSSGAQLDTTFNGTGKMVIPFDLIGGGRDTASDVVMFNDLSILVAGTVQRSATSTNAAVAVVLPNGVLDSAFCSDAAICSDQGVLGVPAGKRILPLDANNPTGTNTSANAVALTEVVGSDIWVGGGAGVGLALFQFGRGSTGAGHFASPIATNATAMDLIYKKPFLYAAGFAQQGGQDVGVVARYDLRKVDFRDFSFGTDAGQPSFYSINSLNGSSGFAAATAWRSLALAPTLINLFNAPTNTPITPIVCVGRARWATDPAGNPPIDDTDLALMSFGASDTIFRDSLETQFDLN
ncbi:MAG: hypothetical protein ABI411_20325 [Tahibacter sp.]